MAHNFGTSINLNKNQILNGAFQNLAAAPSSPVVGQFYYDTALLSGYYWNGSTWRPMDAAKATNIPISALAVDPTLRTNHSGTQLASTISNLASTVQGYSLNQFAAPTAAVPMNGQIFTGLGNGVNPNDSVTMAQAQAMADAARQGTRAKDAVTVVAVSNITLSGLQTIDGVALSAGQTVLATGQTTGTQNGPYVVAAGAWARRTSDDQSAELIPGAEWFVELGTVYAASKWVLRNVTNPVVGTDTLTITQTGASTSYVSGNGIAITGNSIAVNPAASGGIVVGAGGVSLDTAVAVRKYTSAAFGDGSAVTFTITHNLGNQRPNVNVYEVSTNALWQVDVVATNANAVQLTFGTPPTAGQFIASVQG